MRTPRSRDHQDQAPHDHRDRQRARKDNRRPGAYLAEVIELAFDDPPSGPQVMFSVTYRRGRGDKPEGTLVDGGQVRAKNQMVFNVTATDKS